MSLADELLASMGEETMTHEHHVADSGNRFVIDPDTRAITNASRARRTLMQRDHKSEVYTIELPRIVEGHDMTKCNRVRVHFINIETETEPAVENPGVAELDPPIIDPKDSSKAIVTWLIRREATQLAGILSFAVQYECVETDGTVDYEFHSDYYSDINVKAFRDNGEASVIKYSNVLEDWYQKIFGLEGSLIESVTAAAEAQKEAIRLKGEATLASIPEDYTTTHGMADEALRKKADAIVCEAAGKPVVITGSSDDHIRGLKLYGKTTQVTTTGRNLLDVAESVTFEYVLTIPVSIPAGVYILSYTSESHGGDYPPYVRFEDNATGALLSSSPKRYTITLTQDETVVHIYSNNYNAPQSRDVEATIKQLMLSVDGGDYEPYTGGKPAPNPDYPQELVSIENPTIAIHSKNLIPFPYPMFACSNTEELDVIIRDDGGILINGTVTEDSFINLCKHDFGPDHISPTTTSGFIANRHSSGIWVAYDGKNKISFILVKSGTVCNNEVIYPQVEAGTVATEYEKGSGRQSFNTDRTLPGIPVTTGGNYTDENGQQWICDEIDLERGVYVRRINTAVFDGSNVGNWWEYFSPGYEGYARTIPDMLPGVRWRGYCDTFVVHTTGSTETGIWFGASNNVFYLHNAIDQFPSLEYFKEWVSANPITVMYPIETVVETPLTAEEIAAFKVLRTNYSNTTILNDAGAWMSVKYNADTKSYVDNPRTLRLADSSTGVVYELKIVDGSLTVVPV